MAPVKRGAFHSAEGSYTLIVSVNKPVVINGRADISSDDAIKGIVNLDTDGWIKTDELYECLALSFFKVKIRT